jgi:cytochrome c oxidase subunit 4
MAMSDHAHVEQHAPAGATTKVFMVVWLALLALTAIEVFLAYIHTPLTIMLTLLIGLSVIKAVLIIGYFMHMKFEKVSLMMTLFPMLVFCILMLLVFMPDAQRALDLRPR